jgi:hypothetical protein
MNRERERERERERDVCKQGTGRKVKKMLLPVHLKCKKGNVCVFVLVGQESEEEDYDEKEEESGDKLTKTTLEIVTRVS